MIRKITAKIRAWRARRANDASGKVTSGRMTASERSAAFHKVKRP